MDTADLSPGAGLLLIIRPSSASGRARGVIEIGRGHISRVEDRCAHLRNLGASAVIVDSDLDCEKSVGVLEALNG